MTSFPAATPKLVCLQRERRSNTQDILHCRDRAVVLHNKERLISEKESTPFGHLH